MITQFQVRYELLDCNHTFLESVLKLVGLMESGVVRDGEDLVPFLFQFLVLLAYDNSQLVSVPQVSLWFMLATSNVLVVFLLR